MTSQSKLAVLAVCSAIIGVVLLVLAAYPMFQSYPTLWYFQDGKVYRYFLHSRTSQQVALPTQPIAIDFTTPVLSHDGHYLALADKNGLQIVQIADARLFRTVPHKKDDPAQISLTNSAYVPLLWSPNDKWLLIQMWRYEQQGLGFLNVTSGEITEIAGRDIARNSCGFTGAAWAPDNSSIIITNDNPVNCEWYHPFPGVNSATINSPKLQSIFTDTLTVIDGMQQPVQIDSSAGVPAWQPNSEWIVFSQEIGWEFPDLWGRPVYQLYRIRSDGQNPQPITFNSTGEAWSPVWDNRGKRLFFSTYKADNSSDGIYVSSPDGTEPKLLFSGKGLIPLAISPDDGYLAVGLQPVDSVRYSANPLWAKGLWILDLETTEKIHIGAATFVGWQMEGMSP